MTIKLNGEAKSTEARSVAELVEQLGLAAPTLLVEHNGLALRRGEWDGCALSEGDQVEVLRIAAGG